MNTVFSISEKADESVSKLNPVLALALKRTCSCKLPVLRAAAEERSPLFMDIWCWNACRTFALSSVELFARCCRLMRDTAECVSESVKPAPAVDVIGGGGGGSSYKKQVLREVISVHFSGKQRQWVR